MEEIPEQETDDVLGDPACLENVDVICLTYDSANPDSFAPIADLRVPPNFLSKSDRAQERFPHLNLIPTIYAATKADLDRQEQRCDVQPDAYTRALALQPPIHVSALWEATGDLFVTLAEAAGWPGTAVPRSEDEEEWLWGGTNTRLLLAAATFGGLVLSLGGSLVWRAARARWNTVH